MTSATQEPIVFIGTGHATTDTFDCYGHAKITWTTKQEITEYGTPRFSMWIKRYGASGLEEFVQLFSGLGGTTHLYGNGTFYFQTYMPMHIKSWRITVENIESPQFGLTTTTETITVTKTTPHYKTITRTTTTTEKTMQEFGTPILFVSVIFVALMTLNQRRKAK